MVSFAKAKVIEAKPTGKAKQDKLEVPVASLQKMAEIKALMQSLEGAYKSLEGQVKAAGFDAFLALETTTRPDSFRGIDGMASASIEMRKRGTNSALNEDEVKVLEALGITPFKQVITTEMFGINPAYAGDEKLMARVEAALNKIGGLPEDFIVQQAEVSKLVVTEEMMNAAFAKRDRAAIEIVTTMATKPKLNDGYPMEALFDNVKEIVQPSKKAAKVALPGAKKAA